MPFSLNDVPIASGTLQLPRIGVWHADVVAQCSTELAGTAVITVGTTVLRGTVIASKMWAGRNHVRVSAGAGRLALATSTTVPRYYQSTTARQVLLDILSSLGETLDSASVATTPLRSYTVPLSTPLAEIGRLAQACGGSSWRATDTGTIWFGTDTWTPVVVPVTNNVNNIQPWMAEPQRKWLEVAASDVFVRPGQTYDGQRVERVEHYFERGPATAVIYYQ